MRIVVCNHLQQVYSVTVQLLGAMLCCVVLRCVVLCSLILSAEFLYCNVRCCYSESPNSTGSLASRTTYLRASLSLSLSLSLFLARSFSLSLVQVSLVWSNDIACVAPSSPSSSYSNRLLFPFLGFVAASARGYVPHTKFKHKSRI